MKDLACSFPMYVYISTVILTLNLIYAIKVRRSKKIPKFIISLNALAIVVISNLSTFNEGIYVDELNLSGNPIAFWLNIFNNCAFLIILLSSFRNTTEAMNKEG